MVSDVPRTRPAYPPEFRREAIELLRQGRTPGELSKSLGVSPQTLRKVAPPGPARPPRARRRRHDRRARRPRPAARREPAAAAGARSAQASRVLLRNGERDP